jgi:hypothetical protein
MDKTAQRRSIWNKLYELADVPRRSAEDYFRPKFKEVADKINKADDKIRNILLGGKTGLSVKKLLQDARSMINRREYMASVVNLGKFNDRLLEVAKVLDELVIDISAIHHQFLFGKMPAEYRLALNEMRTRYASINEEMFKQAGFKDFWHNIGTPRGRALALWEKRYPEVAVKLKESVLTQLSEAQELLSDILARLKEMDRYRTRREFSKYEEAARSLKNLITASETKFKSFYKTHIVPELEKMEAFEKKQLAEQGLSSVAPTPGASSPAIVSPTIPDLEIPTSKPSVKPTGTPTLDKTIEEVTEGLSSPVPPRVTNPLGTGSFIEAPKPTEPAATPATTPDLPTGLSTQTPAKPAPPTAAEIADKLKPKRKKASKTVPVVPSTAEANDAYAHQSFMKSLEVYSNEDPALLAAHISRYARSIQTQDPETALELFKIAKSLRV